MMGKSWQVGGNWQVASEKKRENCFKTNMKINEGCKKKKKVKIHGLWKNKSTCPTYEKVRHENHLMM